MCCSHGKKARKSKTILGSFFMKYDDKRWLITKVLKQHKSEIDFCEENFRLFFHTNITKVFLFKQRFFFWFQDHESNMFCRALKSLPFAYMFFYEYTNPVSMKLRVRTNMPSWKTKNCSHEIFSKHSNI